MRLHNPLRRWCDMDIQTALTSPSSLDWQPGPYGLAADTSLSTAVLVSLFTDARVNGERGWWGDSYPEPSRPGVTAGSRLWLLERGKQTAQTLRDAQLYAEEALQWLVQDGLASEVAAATSYPAAGVLQLIITIKRGKADDGGSLQIRIDNLWSAYAL